MKIQELLLKLFGLNYALKIKREGYEMCRITIIDQHTNLSYSQTIPQNHLSENYICEVANFCCNKLLNPKHKS